MGQTRLSSSSAPLPSAGFSAGSRPCWSAPQRAALAGAAVPPPSAPSGRSQSGGGGAAAAAAVVAVVAFAVAALEMVKVCCLRAHHSGCPQPRPHMPLCRVCWPLCKPATQGRSQPRMCEADHVETQQLTWWHCQSLTLPVPPLIQHAGLRRLGRRARACWRTRQRHRHRQRRWVRGHPPKSSPHCLLCEHRHCTTLSHRDWSSATHSAAHFLLCQHIRGCCAGCERCCYAASTPPPLS